MKGSSTASGLAVFILLLASLSYATETALVSAIVPDTMPGVLELAILPAPQEAEYGDSMVAVTKVAVIARDMEELRAGAQELRSLFGQGQVVFLSPGAAVPEACDALLLIGGPDRNVATRSQLRSVGKSVPEGKGQEAYLLEVRAGADKHTIVLAGASPQGDYWALQSLKQLAYRKDGKLYLLQATIRDWPVLPLRGCKRPQMWEAAYKANLRFCNGGSPSFHQVFMDAWVRDVFLGSQVDPSDAFIDKISATIDDDVETRGAIGYYLHLDDQPEVVKEDSRHAFPSYQAAVLHILTEFRKRLDARDPGLKIFFMPNSYFYRGIAGHSEFRAYAEALRKAGKLPPNTAVMFNGIGITTSTYPEAIISQYQDAFGVGKGRSLLYYWNNPSRFPGVVHEWSPGLVPHILGISAEAAVAVTRLSIYDWHWNPEAYDPDRSLMLACRELCGLGTWRRLYDAIRLHDDALPGTDIIRRDEALAQYVSKVVRLESAYAALKADKASILKGRLKLPDTMPHSFPFEPIGSLAKAVEGLCGDAVVAAVAKHAFRAAPCETVRKSPFDTPEGWKEVPDADHFVWLSDGDTYGRLAILQACRDRENLYLRMAMRLNKPIRSPAGHEMTVQLDPAHTHEHCYEFRLGADNRGEDALYTRHPKPARQGYAYDSGWSHKVTRNDELWASEFCIPLNSLPGKPESGTAWGLRVFIQKGATRNTFVWPSMTGSPGRTAMDGAGHLVFYEEGAAPKREEVERVTKLAPSGKEIQIRNIADAQLNAHRRYVKRCDGGSATVSVTAMSGWKARGLMRFDLAKVAGKKIAAAKLQLRMVRFVGGHKEETIAFHEVLKPWDEMTVNWLSFNNGGAEGTEFNAVPYCTQVWKLADSESAITLDFKPRIFQKWADAPAKNFGFILINKSPQNPAPNRGKGFVSSDAPMGGPVLVLTVE